MQVGSPDVRRAGFSLLETLIALAVLSLGATVVLTRSSAAIAQVTDHAVFFDFQRQVSDLRRQAWRGQSPVLLTTPAASSADGGRPAAASDGPQEPADGAATLSLALRPGWTYTLSRPLRMEASGECRNVTADLLRDGKLRVHLISQDKACHFIRTVERSS